MTEKRVANMLPARSGKVSREKANSAGMVVCASLDFFSVTQSLSWTWTADVGTELRGKRYF